MLLRLLLSKILDEVYMCADMFAYEGMKERVSIYRL